RDSPYWPGQLINTPNGLQYVRHPDATIEEYELHLDYMQRSPNHFNLTYEEWITRRKAIENEEEMSDPPTTDNTPILQRGVTDVPSSGSSIGPDLSSNEEIEAAAETLATLRPR